MKVVAYVLDKNKNPLMPCFRSAKVRHLLKNKEAKIVEHKPFTIQLLKETTCEKQDLILGIDPGRTNIGLCVVTKDGKEIFSSNVTTRNKEIKKLMDDRRGTRRRKRMYKRMKRQRRFIKLNPDSKIRVIERYLPHYEKPIYCKVFKNKPSRFCNRKRK